jgi:hypothetical protein
MLLGCDAVRTGVSFMTVAQFNLCQAVLGAIILGGLAHLQANDTSTSENRNRPPVISPDYRNTVIPPNIAPLNFYIQEHAQRYRVRLRAPNSAPWVINSRTPLIDIPARGWREMLRANRGQPLYWDVSVQTTNGAWQSFTTITNSIAKEEIEPYLVYRLLNWQFSMYSSGTMGIYQRHLESFEETTLLRALDHFKQDAACMNCHTFLQNQPDTMALHIRSEKRGKPMLLARAGEVTTVDRPAGLLSWHPSGRLMIQGVNKFSMLYHSVGRNRDVFDSAGDLNVYFLDDHRVEKPPQIATTRYWETWPAWSPDGESLYFCRTPVSSKSHYRNVKYDLMRVSYDLENNAWGEPETVLAVRDTGRSIAQPRVSPDGQWLLFCMFPYSSFPGTQPESDLYLLELATGKYRSLTEANSEQSESWPSWSRNSRWIVFSSKRRDGLLTRPYFCYINEQGQAHKPFLLPQKDPASYDSLLKMYNLPELVAGPVAYSSRELYNAIYRPAKAVTPKESGGSAASVSSDDEYSPLPGSQRRDQH